MVEVIEVEVADVSDVPIPSEVPISDFSDEQLIKLHYESWKQREVYDVFGVSDLQHERMASNELDSRGWECQPESEYYCKYL